MDFLKVQKSLQHKLRTQPGHPMQPRRWVHRQEQTTNTHCLHRAQNCLCSICVQQCYLAHPFIPPQCTARHVVKRPISQDARCWPTQTTYTECGTHANMLKAHPSAKSLHTWPLLYMAKPRQMN